MISLPHVYALIGAFFVAVAICSALDRSDPRRWRTAGFWALLAASFIFGKTLGDLSNGVLALALACLGALGLGRGERQETTPDDRRAAAERRGNWLFLPALIIPAVALLGTLAAKETSWGAALIDPKQATIVALTIGVLVCVGVMIVWTRAPLLAPITEGKRLLDTVGWAILLPQMLASLGAVFLVAGVGDEVGKLVSNYVPLDDVTLAVAAYCVGMALFTIVMGNAFAAFPVMTAAIGLPILVQKFHGNPATVCAIGMLAGFCGTLTTPMAANFNVVPANLLELPDRKSPFNGVIRAQLPTAIPLLLVNIALMRLLAFHG